MAAEAPGRTGRFEFDPSEAYSLAASVRFLEGFTPARYERDGSDRLRFAFFADGFGDVGERAAGALVDREGGKVVVETFGEARPGVVRGQVGRILSLDVDGSGFPGVGVRDPIVAEL